MIILSGVLVVLAIALLVTGIVTGNTGHEIAGLDGLKLIYVSIGVSIVSALFLAIGVFLRRKELFGSAASQTSSKKASTSAVKAGKAARPTKTKARVGAGDETPIIPVASASATDVPAETTVYVVPGRKRYHLDTCRQLAGRDKEELTFVEAREEGFTACTACLPDTALAARAALTDTETAERPAETDPAQITRTDLPVAAGEPVTEQLATAEPEPATDHSVAHDDFTDSPVDRDDFTDHTTVDRDDFTDETVNRDDSTDRTGYADYTDHADLAEHTETAEPVEEEPATRSRSLFEPLNAGRDDEQPEDVEPEPSHDEHFTSPEPATDEEPEAPTDLDEPTESDTAPEADTDEYEPVPAPDEAAEPEATHESAADEQDAEEPSEDTSEPEATDSTSEAEPEPAEDTATATDTSDSTEAAESAEDAETADEETDAPDSLSIVRILSGTKRYHRTDCALIEDIAEDADDLETVTPEEAKDRGCTPCLVCQPDKDYVDDF